MQQMTTPTSSIRRSTAQPLFPYLGLVPDVPGLALATHPRNLKLFPYLGLVPDVPAILDWPGHNRRPDGVSVSHPGGGGLRPDRGVPPQVVRATAPWRSWRT